MASGPFPVRAEGETTRVLAFPRYGAAGPSSRYRLFQYLPALRERGIDVEVRPLLDDAYVEALYGRGARPPALVARAFVRRLADLLEARRADLLWIEGELFPWLPAGFERLLAALRIPYAVDYDDALFHRYDQAGSRLTRAALGDKIDRVMRSAAVVVAGNRYLAERAARAGARRIEIVPTVVDLARYPAREADAPAPFTLAWIGSPGTQRYLSALAEPLRALQGSGPCRLLAIGASPDFAIPGVAVERAEWSEPREAELLATAHAGVMPLPDEPFSWGKCGLKLIQYMASSLPVIASPIGANRDIVSHGENGFLAATAAEWTQALERLRGNDALRSALGKAGRARVEARYSLAAQAPALASVLAAVARRRS